MSERSVEAVIADLDQLVTQYAEQVLNETKIQDQISALRAQLTDVQIAKRGVKQRRLQLEQEKESAMRQAALKNEQEEIERKMRFLIEEAEKLIAEAPWRSIIFDWQVSGAVKLAAAKRGLLADTRGMGKTLSSIAWRRLVKANRTLVLTRKQYVDEFIKELQIREPEITVIPLVGANGIQRKMMTGLMQKHDNFIMVVNFETWRRSTDEVIADLLSVDFDTVILDEAHQLKNFQSVTTKGFLQIAAKVENLLEMTGTPVQNRPQELFAMLHSLWPDLFPRESYFVRDYCWQVEQNRWIFKPGGLQELMKKMDNFFVARTPDDVGHKIPPPDIKHFKLDFDGYPEQAEVYRMMAERALAKINEGKALPIVSQLALMTRQAQLTSWPAGITFRETNDETGEEHTYKFDIHQSVKLDWAEDLINELIEEGQRIILFSRFKAPIIELDRRLKATGRKVGYITGDTSRAHNRELIDDFDPRTVGPNPKYSVLLATYDTVGESVNLNDARHCILLDRYWKPSKDDQAIGRIDRLNSVGQATVYMAAVDKTIDIYMEKLIDSKREMLGGFKTANEMQQGLKENLEATLW
jgi:SNF2 family DNA or RNA helicase